LNRDVRYHVKLQYIYDIGDFERQAETHIIF